MTPQRWQSIELLFDQVADLPPAERACVLAAADAGLREEVERLLAADSRGGQAVTAAVEEGHDLLVSQRFGPYRVTGLAGRGGMGAVFKAVRDDGAFQKQVAVKVMHTGLDGGRFLQERAILAALEHPHIARLLDGGETETGAPYIVLEYVDGVPLLEYCSREKLSTTVRLRLFLDICSAVQYAHQNLVVHRDLKPGNILVTSDGMPKLLDFGIAKLLDNDPARTATAHQALTPHYASPEQVRGGAISAATDVYSLGVILYELLTGRRPYEFPSLTAADIDKTVCDTEPAAPRLSDDLDNIILKALRKEPARRYASVQQLADDIERSLTHLPVLARPDTFHYRAAKFLRRNWAPVAAAIVTIAGLSLGLYTANRERAIAQRRFTQVRQLAGRILSLDTTFRAVPGAIKARHEIVAVSKEYLEGLSDEASRDKELAVEIAFAYIQLARIQGVPGLGNLGQPDKAEESLRRAGALVEPVLADSPQNRTALLTSAMVAHDRMILADSARRDAESLEWARKSAQRLDLFTDQEKASDSESASLMVYFTNIAQAHKNQHLYQDAIAYARKAIDFGRAAPGSRYAGAMSVMADAMRFSGDLAGALKIIQEARALMEKSDFRTNGDMFGVLWREGAILGEDWLGQPEQAIAVLQEAFDLLDDWTRKDPDDASPRVLFASAGRELGGALRQRDPRRALSVYDHALHRLGEIKNNAKARRGEAELLAASSYPLLRLNGATAAKDRIESAFRLLRGTNDYPASRITPDDEADHVLRALADYHAETGQPQRAAEVYHELLDKIMATTPDPQNDLRHAKNLSRIYEALARLHRRNGQPDQGEAMASLRLELWRHWNRKLPHNEFLRRQVEAAQSQ